MHIITRILSLVLLLTLPGLALADKGGKGPSDRAYERASDNASFKRTDGKPGKAKKDKHKEHSHDDDDRDRDYDRDGDRDREQDQDREQSQTGQQEGNRQADESSGQTKETGSQGKKRGGFIERIFGGGGE